MDNNKRIMCVGMCVLDIIHVCETYPSEDTDKRCLQGYWQRGGNASNNCTVLRKLGIEKVEFLGMLSTSDAFKYLHNDCNERKIMIENCPLTEQAPPFSSIILSKTTASRTIIHSNGNFPILRYGDFQAKINLENYCWIHFEARNPEETLQMLNDIHIYNYNCDDDCEKIIISVELEKIRLENLVLAALADYVFLGKDLAQFLGYENARSASFGLKARIQAQAAARKHRLPAIICTWGAEGCGCLDQNDDYAHIAPKPAGEIVDSLGAGDTFCAAVIYALAHLKMQLKDAVSFGNACAGYKLGHQGFDAIQDFNAQMSSMLKEENNNSNQI